MHRLLERQIKRFLGERTTLPPNVADFLNAVEDAYSRADADQQMIERSLELMSQELNEANAQLRDELKQHQLAEILLHQEKEEQLELIQKLEETQNQLMQSDKLASIGQLAAGVAHEINNPIGYVYSNLGTLNKYVHDIFIMLDNYERAEGGIADKEVRAQLQEFKKKLDLTFLKEDVPALLNESKDGITRVKTIVQSLKDFAHANAADSWQFADLHNGLDSTLNIVNNEIKYKATVVKHYGNIPEIECLPTQLNQVFMNLLVNASHAIETRGTITLQTGQQEGEVWVEIIDTGNGISPDNLQKIFDPFFTTKAIGKGTGLGLSVSYGIILKHHGRIEVQSEVGKGSTFKVWLPIKHTPQELQELAA
jgi:signal transduction histidine kinase